MKRKLALRARCSASAVRCSARRVVISLRISLAARQLDSEVTSTGGSFQINWKPLVELAWASGNIFRLGTWMTRPVL